MSGILKSFQVNDQVVFLDEVGGGVITRIEGKYYYVVDETGFERPFLAEQLSPLIQSMNNIAITELNQEKSNQNSSKSIQQTDGDSAIDLHIEQLVENHVGWTNHEILTYQLRAFRSFIAKSEDQRKKRIVVIHGIGNGRLKEEIQIFLQKSKRYQFCDADFAKYGFGGATQIDIRMNWKD